MISWPDAAASISGVNPNTGSLVGEKVKGQTKKKKKLHVSDVHVGVRVLLDVGICVVVQEKLDHLLMSSARAVQKSCPTPAVLTLKLRPLLYRERPL